MESAPKKSCIVLAAGGTGGHLFPAEALAEALLARGERPVLATDPRFQGYITGALSALETHTIRTRKPGRGVFARVLLAASLFKSTLSAWVLLGKLKPRAVIGFGGYPAFPTVLAATLRGIPSLIHEQNAVLGRANRLLAGRVNRIATACPQVHGLRPEQAGRAVMVGNPVRAAVKAIREVPYPELSTGGMLRLLVTGGSQGAQVMGEVVPEALALLPAEWRDRIRLDLQCRDDAAADVRAKLLAIGVHADLAPFFPDIPARLAAAHLVIARAGASTVAELAVAGRPAILVPLPTAMDDHQSRNAEALAGAGGAWVMAQAGFTPAALAARLESFLHLPAALTDAARQARMAGMPDAAEKLADLVLGVQAESDGKTSLNMTTRLAA